MIFTDCRFFSVKQTIAQPNDVLIIEYNAQIHTLTFGLLFSQLNLCNRNFVFSINNGLLDLLYLLLVYHDKKQSNSVVKA